MPKRRPGLQVVTRAGSASLYLRGTIQGRRIFESSGTDQPALAEERRALREVEIYRGAVYQIPERVTFAAAALSYLQTAEHAAGTRARVGRLLRDLGPDIGCGEVTQATLDATARRLCRPSSNQGTRHREVFTPAKAVLTHAARRGWCQAPVFETVRASSKRTEWFTPSEAEAIVTAARPRDAALITFLFCTGARVGEALALKWDTVDLQHGRAVLLDTKSGEDRIASLPPRAIAALANLPGKRTGHVFRTRTGTAYRSTNDSRSTPYGNQIARMFRRTMKLAGIKRHMTPHHCRHTWASWHYCLFKDLVKLRDDGCWKTVAMCERYTKLVPDGLRSQVEEFWGAGANVVHPADTLRNAG